MTFKPSNEFVALMEQHGVPYCLVGGHAVQAHGYVRQTEDMDIVWLRDEQSAARLLGVLQLAGAQWIGNERDPATGLEKMHAVSAAYVASHRLMMLWTDYGFVDLFDYIPGFGDDDVQELLDTAMVLEGVRYASLEWLKKMKLAAGRPQDLADLEQLP